MFGTSAVSPGRRSPTTAAVVRRLRRRDIPEVVELRRLCPDDVTTPESVAWSIDHADRGERARRWVASAAGRVVGWAVAGRASWTADRVAYAFFGVQPERRRPRARSDAEPGRAG